MASPLTGSATETLRPVARQPGSARLVLLALVGTLCACASPGPDHTAIITTSPARLGLVDARSLPVAERWWTQWGDAQLDRLMEQALQDHPGQALARARVERADALAAVRLASAGAQVGLSAEVTRQRYSENGLMPASIAGHTRDTGNMRTTLTWTPDFFGQQATDLAAAVGQARAAQADAAFAATSLSAQVARTYIGLARLLAQRRIGECVLAQREQVAALTRARESAGLDSQLELAQADGAVPDARGQIAALDEQVSLARRQLAMLAGQAPDSQDHLSPVLQRIPVEPSAQGLGTDLLGRRPDVVAARWRVEASLQDVQLARLQFYPNVNLGAFIGLNSLGLGQLLRAGSVEYGVTPALRLPLFDGGRLRAQLGARQADLDAAIAQYNTVLQEAVREAGDSLLSERWLQQQTREQSAALASAELAHALARRRFDAGLGNYLLVLQAESPVLAQRRMALDLQARQLDNRVLLIRALGGGWQDGADAATAASP